MNDDIVERLRLMCDRFYGFPDVTADLTAAADEIVRLRALLGNAVGAIIDSGGYCEGPHDVADAIYRLTAERDNLSAGLEDFLKADLRRRAVGGAPGVSETHTDPKEAPVNEDERWGAEPTIDAPEGTSWDGPWRRAKRYYPADDDDTAELVWARDALEHDDHEDCCHHTRHVTIAVTTRENQA